MNKKLGLAVAGALFALSSSANAGIIIPAGEWTLDVGGVVNAYYTSTSYSGTRGAATSAGGFGLGNGDTTNNITTGLLPNYLSVSGKSRQNDLDIAFTISINPGASTTAAGFQGAQQENRQAFLTLGDASWGSVKLGKDLGIYASDAILNDMTLLGVGAGAGALAGNTTTLGRIGSGFMYADWKSQVAYTTPNWNGFQATVGVTQAFNTSTSVSRPNNQQVLSAGSRGGSQPAFEAKASYAFTGDALNGKVWASGISQKVKDISDALAPLDADGTRTTDSRATAFDMGANLNFGNLGLTGYYGQGNGIGQTFQLANGFDANGKKRDSHQWYTQATYVMPTTTKLGVSYGESTLDGNRVDTYNDITDSMWTVGAYHPITKSVNLVAEYSRSEREVDNRNGVNAEGRAKSISLGAILFF